MMILQWCKMQMVCLLILGYIGVTYIREGNTLNRISKRTNCNYLFDALFVDAELALVFDGVTACTVNFTDVIPHWLNLMLHLGMYVTYEVFITLLFLYWVSVTTGTRTKKKFYRSILPCALGILLTIVCLPQIEFRTGMYTNYSMGSSVYICFGLIVIYAIMTFVLIAKRFRYIPRMKMKSLMTTLLWIVIILILQILLPEFLLSSVAISMVTISVYLNMENPAIKELQHYHREMVMGFATLVENRDDSTGGHIRRSSAYAGMIAENLRENRDFRKKITKDFLNNLEKAAPMHDIGKVGIPDSILQKPGKLTEEEFAIMKEHPVIGDKIIRESFGNLGNEEYEVMAHEITLYHHEKWDGSGYPIGLRGAAIPLAARIMAVADVFDAVSAKRCYRDALPLSECYEIIRNGRGTDFDPAIVDAFFLDIDHVESIFRDETDEG